jgi:Bestrophin, RFP-TM, chloride channel
MWREIWWYYKIKNPAEEFALLCAHFNFHVPMFHCSDILRIVQWSSRTIFPRRSECFWQNYRQFTDAAIYCNSFSNLLPLSFVLGFFVSRVYTRFWEQLSLIPWPVRPAIYVSAYLRGHGDESRMMRRSILRYLVLSLVMTLTFISPQAKKRFPTFSCGHVEDTTT